VPPAHRGGDASYAEGFLLEVRRFFPFFPAVVARLAHDFTWREHRLGRGTRV
jgi:fatty-acid peroxygenase